MKLLIFVIFSSPLLP